MFGYGLEFSLLNLEWNKEVKVRGGKASLKK
jgi:hypothetical protein